MKNYILDTTVLLHDAQALYGFGGNNVYLPISVIEDIDHFKKDVTETGRNARQTSRYLDALRNRGSLISGVELPGAGTLFIKTVPEQALRSVSAMFQERNHDLHVLAVAVSLKDTLDAPTVLVTKDVNL